MKREKKRKVKATRMWAATTHGKIVAAYGKAVWAHNDRLSSPDMGSIVVSVHVLDSRDYRALLRDAKAKPYKASDSDVIAWGARHDIKLHGIDLRAAFEDAQTLNAKAAAMYSTPSSARKKRGEK